MVEKLHSDTQLLLASSGIRPPQNSTLTLPVSKHRVPARENGTSKMVNRVFIAPKYGATSVNTEETK